MILTLTLITVLSVTACAGKSARNESNDYPYENEGSYEQYDYGDSDDAGRSAASMEKQRADYEYTPDNTVAISRKVIRNADLQLHSDDAKEFYKTVTKYGESLGGYEYAYSLNNYSNYLVISATFKVPPEKLTAFLAFIEENGDVTSSSVSSDDITDSYYDTQTRLETKRNTLMQYYELLKKAKTVEEIVYVQKIIDGITEDIEALEGRLKRWNSETDMATVYMHITEFFEQVEERKEINWNALSFDDMGYLIKLGFVNISNFLVSLIQWLFIIILATTPIWVIVLIILWRLGAFKKRSKKEKAQKPVIELPVKEQPVKEKKNVAKK